MVCKLLQLEIFIGTLPSNESPVAWNRIALIWVQIVALKEKVLTRIFSSKFCSWTRQKCKKNHLRIARKKRLDYCRMLFIPIDNSTHYFNWIPIKWFNSTSCKHPKLCSEESVQPTANIWEAVIISIIIFLRGFSGCCCSCWAHTHTYVRTYVLPLAKSLAVFSPDQLNLFLLLCRVLLLFGRKLLDTYLQAKPSYS